MEPNKITYNEDQKIAIKRIVNFIKTGDPQRFLLIDGKAGTGKTFIVKQAIKNYKRKAVIAALSNKAKKVIRDSMKGVSGGNFEYYSVAGMLGMKLDIETGMFKRERSKNLPPVSSAKLLIIDEGSMVNEEALYLIFKLKRYDAKVIFLGDVGQLPPIRSLSNPFYKNYSQGDLNKLSPIFSTGNFTSLRERIRQGEDSPILPFADYYWENGQLEMPSAFPVPKEKRVSIINDNGALILVDEGKEIIDKLLPIFEVAVKEGRENLIKFIAYTNDTRKKVNQYIHNKLFKNRPNTFQKGELIIFNNSFGTIDNSTEAQVRDVSQVHVSDEGLGFYYIKINPEEINKEIVVDIPILHPDYVVQYNKIVSEMFAKAFSFKETDYNMYIRLLKDAWEQKNKYADVDFAYAITSHKCQGSTYDIAIIHEKDINKVMMITERTKSQSIYTALTRPKNIAILLSSEPVLEKVDLGDMDLLEFNKKCNDNRKKVEDELVQEQGE